MGSKSFIERVNSILGSLVKARKINENGEGYQLRESSGPYGGVLEAENEDIGPTPIFGILISSNQQDILLA